MARLAKKLVIDAKTSHVKIWLADKWFQRAIGLLATPSLDEVAGLWISPCDSVHTMWMRYTIDVVFTDREGKVIGIRDSVRPWRMALCRGAHSVVELRAGLREVLGIRLGNHLSLA